MSSNVGRFGRGASRLLCKFVSDNGEIVWLGSYPKDQAPPAVPGATADNTGLLSIPLTKAAANAAISVMSRTLRARGVIVARIPHSWEKRASNVS